MTVSDGNTLRQLATEIFRCPILAATLRGDDTPCRKVISWNGLHQGPRYLPEPWTGHLAEAPILFLSSNPSAGKHEEPVDPVNWNTSESSDNDLFKGADGAFEADQRPGIIEVQYLVDRNGKVAGRAVPFWRWNRRIAGELLGRDPVPGRDYALTEVVHCGSRDEFGVPEAASTCAGRYLARVLNASPARVIVVAGAKARDRLESVTDLRLDDRVWGPEALFGRERYVIALPHPNRRGTLWGVEPHLGRDRTLSVGNFARESSTA